MASTADCKKLLDTDPSIQAFGGVGPWVRRSKRKTADGVERLFANTAELCFVRVLEGSDGCLKVDRVGGSLEEVQVASASVSSHPSGLSLFERFPPTADEDSEWSGRVLFDIDTADGEEEDDDTVSFYCGFETRYKDQLFLNDQHSPAVDAMMSALFAREAEEGRLNASDAESFHSITCAEGQSRAQLSRRIRKVLLDAGALDTSDPSYEQVTGWMGWSRCG